MGLKTDIYSFLKKSERLCAGCREAEPILNGIREMQARLEMPLRVAVVGIMKAGKSTFMNALMGKNILETGTLETTYTVSWFRYGDTPSLTVVLRDGKELQKPFEELPKWTTRAAGKENPFLNNVRYVIIHYPSDVLKKMEFIDTPGLNSVYGTDAQNTLDFLSVSSSQDTLTEASKADAVIYAFSRSAGNFDRNILNEFNSGNLDTSPINSIGILTKADMTGIWNIMNDETPVEAALAVTKNQMENPDIKRQLFSIYPVCAKAAEGCSKLSKSEWSLLFALSQRISIEELTDYLFDARTFCECGDEEYEQIGTKDFRALLIEKLGQYGIIEAVRQIKSGRSEEEIVGIMKERCGITTVSNVLQSHFGNRTFMIKAQFIFNYLKPAVLSVRKKEAKNSVLFNICDQMLTDIESIVTSLQTFKELKVLQMYYNNRVRFDQKEETEDFLRITGEYGKTVEEKLGMPFGSTVSELQNAVEKKVAQWHLYASDYMKDRNYIEAAKIISRSYEQILYHLRALNDD